MRNVVETPSTYIFKPLDVSEYPLAVCMCKNTIKDLLQLCLTKFRSLICDGRHDGLTYYIVHIEDLTATLYTHTGSWEIEIYCTNICVPLLKLMHVHNQSYLCKILGDSFHFVNPRHLLPMSINSVLNEIDLINTLVGDISLEVK